SARKVAAEEPAGPGPTMATCTRPGVYCRRRARRNRQHRGAPLGGWGEGSKPKCPLLSEGGPEVEQLSDWDRARNRAKLGRSLKSRGHFGFGLWPPRQGRGAAGSFAQVARRLRFLRAVAALTGRRSDM